MADGNPFASVMSPNARQAGLWDLRMMSAANRMETPFERGTRSSYGHQGVAGNPMFAGMAGMANEPDYSSFTYNPQARTAATQALAPYGQRPLEANEVKNNVILPNKGFFGSHPHLSAALESGMLGAAAAHGGMTAGDTIQGALTGIIGGQRMKEGMWRQQFARPFEAAGMMEGLRDAQQKRELQEADIQHLRTMNEHLKNGDDLKAQQLAESNRHNEAVEAMRNTQLEATAPRNLGGGLYGYYNPPPMAPTPGQQGAWSIQENPEAKIGRAAGAAANAGPWFQDKAGTWHRVHEGVTTPEGAKFASGTYEQKREDKAKDVQAAAKAKWLTRMTDPRTGAALQVQLGIAPGDKDAQKKLGKFYDDNIAPSLTQPEASGTQTYNPETGRLE